MSVDSLLAQHVRILNAAADLEQLCAEPGPVAAPALARTSWALARDLLLYLGEVEAQLYARLPDASRTAAAMADADALVAALRSHVERWHTVPGIEAWAEHRAAARDLAARIGVRLDQEARDIVTLLPALPSTIATPSARNGYAAEAWRLRAILFGLAPLPPA